MTSYRCPAALGLLAVVLSAGSAIAAPTQYPLELENCGRTLRFEKAPSRTVSIGQSTTEILYLLGLSEKVAGTALWVGPVLPGYEEANAKVKRLADNDPSFESVVAERPDLVTTQFEWQVGPQGVVATPEQFHELGIPVYTSPADCKGKDNSGGGDGTRTARFMMDLVYQEVEDLARIFDVQDRGAALVTDLKARETAAKAKIAGLKADTSAVFWFSSAELDIDPYVAGQSGAPGYIMSLLGVRNVIDSQEEWPTVGWETIARANPTVIVAGRMDRRRFPADDIAVKLQFLRTDPVASLMPAVHEGRVVEMDAQAMNPTIRTIDGIEVLADALEKAGLAR
ncbi:ABC transporter substrate-binding protein [Aureimonas phyllosphaerae]|uniref:Iron complex transport system substrate-binding protein n=1 Tax=Aureimonas phyllosphaerae TaxID=1166078 RepID=A0A7W6FW11_9HYPH|nr:ABC transporter substrate-binding protein [Aureimonas phyllosphaerae]MBB3937844.1 iron complex transport system substrate-binding protein [Aureimonas phyllosphaerae]MBB3961825.1 iron complex transport system substrate-binding protein [Aureimonas phyllosphaerae]SFF50719.1 iron complex transport system substrate-binding protein [Aureimonas phyllosphaerae]